MNVDHYRMLNYNISAEMAEKGLKILAYAWKRISIDQLKEILERVVDMESYEFREAILCNMAYVGTFGLEDPIRDEVKESIKLIRYGTTK